MKRASQRRNKNDKLNSPPEGISVSKLNIVHPPPTTHDLKKIIKDLEEELREEKMKRQKLEEHF